MKSEIIDFIQGECDPIRCLFENELLDARSYWYANYNSDECFNSISKIIDTAVEDQTDEVYGKGSYLEMLPSFRYAVFLGYYKSNEPILRRDLEDRNINLKNQMDFYLVEFFRNANQAYKMLLQSDDKIEENNLYKSLSHLSSYIKAASDCYHLWKGSEIIKRGQSMGIFHVKEIIREERSRGGRCSRVQFVEAQDLAVTLAAKGNSVGSIARSLKAEKNKNPKFKIPGNNGHNLDSIEKAVRRWFKKLGIKF
jgi:hypothetical protein